MVGEIRRLSRRFTSKKLAMTQWQQSSLVRQTGPIILLVKVKRMAGIMEATHWSGLDVISLPPSCDMESLIGPSNDQALTCRGQGW